MKLNFFTLFSFLLIEVTAARLLSKSSKSSKACGSSRKITYTGKIMITNLSPMNGTFQTPVWVGLHDGTFDLYDRGAPISPELERLAEDGTVDPLSNLFNMDPGAEWDGVGGTGPIEPGATAEVPFEIEVYRGSAVYLSYATMVIPSNDAFLANGNPTAHMVFKPNGKPANFEPVIDTGMDVLDAGSEVNDEVPANTAFFGQMAPDTGVEENGTVELHPGFLPVGSGGILDSSMFSNADFTQSGYQMLKIDVYVESH